MITFILLFILLFVCVQFKIYAYLDAQRELGYKCDICRRVHMKGSDDRKIARTSTLAGVGVRVANPVKCERVRMQATFLFIAIGIATVCSSCANPKPYLKTDAELISDCLDGYEKKDRSMMTSVCSDPQVLAVERKSNQEDVARGRFLTYYDAIGVTPEMIQGHREKDHRDAAAILTATGNSIASTQSARPELNTTSSPASTTTRVTQQQTSHSNNSPIAGSGSQPALQCISVTRPKGENWALMQNLCNHYITVDWCYAGAGGDCKNGTWGGGNLGVIPPNGNRQASTYISGASQYGLNFSVCSGRDAYIQVAGPHEFTCK